MKPANGSAMGREQERAAPRLPRMALISTQERGASFAALGSV